MRSTQLKWISQLSPFIVLFSYCGGILYCANWINFELTSKNFSRSRLSVLQLQTGIERELIWIKTNTNTTWHGYNVDFWSSAPFALQIHSCQAAPLANVDSLCRATTTSASLDISTQQCGLWYRKISYYKMSGTAMLAPLSCLKSSQSLVPWLLPSALCVFPVRTWGSLTVCPGLTDVLQHLQMGHEP